MAVLLIITLINLIKFSSTTITLTPDTFTQFLMARQGVEEFTATL